MIDYEKEITKYGKSLSAQEREKARGVFNELLECGRSFEWLYFAIKHLDGKSILNYPRLMFYRPFQEEVDLLVQQAREKEQMRKERNAEICAKIEAQILQWQGKPVKVIRQSRQPKQVKVISLAEIAEMDDYQDDVPQAKEKASVEKTDSKNNLLRRVRGL